MKIVTSDRGFRHLIHPVYVEPHDESRIVSESSAVGDYADSFDRPGSSFLWVGDNHHLDREQVAALILAMRTWLDTGRLPEGV